MTWKRCLRVPCYYVIRGFLFKFNFLIGMYFINLGDFRRKISIKYGDLIVFFPTPKNSSIALTWFPNAFWIAFGIWTRTHEMLAKMHAESTSVGRFFLGYQIGYIYIGVYHRQFPFSWYPPAPKTNPETNFKSLRTWKESEKEPAVLSWELAVLWKGGGGRGFWNTQNRRFFDPTVFDI